jgi:hypothetical protein
MINRVIILVPLLLLAACGGKYRGKNTNQNASGMVTDSTNQYGYNRDFLKRHIPVIELKRNRSAVLIVPGWQGRVMTSTSEGDKGFSFGWINRDLISSGRVLPHINPFGGEERLWLGPEGGQFSVYFEKGKSFVYDNWQVPAFLDTMPFKIVSATDTSALFTSGTTLVNYSGSVFTLKIDREVALPGEKEIMNETGVDVRGLSYVAYRSVNTLTNTGDNRWTKDTGLLSIWMLGMFIPSPSVVIVIPFKPGDENLIGPCVNDNYFGKIDSERLKITGKHIFFRADGKSRGKIGIPPLRATGTMGSYDAENNILTLLICNLPKGRTDYVNSSWQIQEKPFSGDALNAYNDGPLEDGSQMGPFYELEASSPAAALSPGESVDHIQFTFHLTGDKELLDKLAGKILGTGIKEISEAFQDK